MFQPVSARKILSAAEREPTQDALFYPHFGQRTGIKMKHDGWLEKITVILLLNVCRGG